MTKRIIISAIISLAIFFAMRWQGNVLITDASNYGILSFEFAKTFDEAKTIIASAGKVNLQINITIDFAFIIGYSFFLFFCCRALMNAYRSSGLKTLALIFLELSILVGVLDLIENVAMLITLGGYGSDISVTISRWAAIIKFSLVALVMAYIVIAAVFVIILSKKKN